MRTSCKGHFLGSQKLEGEIFNIFGQNAQKQKFIGQFWDILSCSCRRRGAVALASLTSCPAVGRGHFSITERTKVKALLALQKHVNASTCPSPSLSSAGPPRPAGPEGRGGAGRVQAGGRGRVRDGLPLGRLQPGAREPGAAGARECEEGDAAPPLDARISSSLPVCVHSTSTTTTSTARRRSSCAAGTPAHGSRSPSRLSTCWWST